MKHIVFVLLILFFNSCSDGLENLGTVSVTKINPGNSDWVETTIELKKGDVLEFWNDMSVETKQKNKLLVEFKLIRYVDGKYRGEYKMNALKTNPTLLDSKGMSRGRMIWSFQGKMRQVNITESGKYTFKVALFTSDEALLLNRANLVFKRRND